MNTRLLDGVQALVFDTYGTVVDWRGGVLEVARGLRGVQGLAVDWDAFLVDWDTRPILDLINTGQMPWMTMEAVHRHALGPSLARFGMAGLTDGEIDQLVTARWRLRPWPDSVPGLTRLKARYVISPLSNASFVGMVKLAKFARLPWDCVITAENARFCRAQLRPPGRAGAGSPDRVRPPAHRAWARPNYRFDAGRAVDHCRRRLRRPCRPACPVTCKSLASAGSRAPSPPEMPAARGEVRAPSPSRSRSWRP